MAGGTPAHAVLSLRVGAPLDGASRGSRTVASSDLNIDVEATALSTYPDVSDDRRRVQDQSRRRKGGPPIRRCWSKC